MDRFYLRVIFVGTAACMLFSLASLAFLAWSFERAAERDAYYQWERDKRAKGCTPIEYEYVVTSYGEGYVSTVWACLNGDVYTRGHR